ncbi:hypothetical protein GCM10009801_58310 [Streptomyces albiaxialis]|uniref:Uncharacterized protein n=1 Tax=Streptomyces albiaxialis TaxID=329523 RepID=A0ABN2WGQ1_9ACTN
MTFGFAPPPAPDSPSRLSRTLEPAEWAAAGIPLLRDPRETVTGLCERHSPRLSTAVVAVIGPDERLVASASFDQRSVRPDGWAFRNALLDQLRRVIPHDLRRRSPVRTAILLYCRNGEQGWTEVDGAWMWGLRDACTLHGLRCGAYVTLTGSGWQVLGEGRGGRRPSAGAPTSAEPTPLTGRSSPERKSSPTPRGPASRGSATRGSSTRDPATRGSVPQGSATQGSAIRGSAARAPAVRASASEAPARPVPEPAAQETPPQETPAQERPAPEPPAPAPVPASKPAASGAPPAAAPAGYAPSEPPAPATPSPVPVATTPLEVNGGRAARRGTSSAPGRSGDAAAVARARAGAETEAAAGAAAS